jgi:hypothetical protein
LREGLPTLASRGGTFRSLRRGDPSKSSPRQQRVRITASFCLPAVAVRPPHPPPAASFRRRSRRKGLPLALPHPGRLQAGVEGRGAKPDLCKQRSGSGAGSRVPAEAGRMESGDCHRAGPTEAGFAWWGSPFGVGRSRCLEVTGTLSGAAEAARDIGAGWRGPPKRASYPVTGLPRRQAGDVTSKLVTGGPGGRCAAPASRCRHRPGRSREGGEPPSDFPGQGDSRHLRREAGAEGPSPKTSVRLRSACADPHITEGSLGDGVRRSPAEAGEVLPIVRSGVDGGLSLHPLPGSAINCPPEGAADFKALLR